METFDDYLHTIEHQKQRQLLQNIFSWIETTFPQLEQHIGWNQPMYTHHKTYIIGFSVAKQHLSISPEIKAMAQFSQEIEANGYTQTKNLYRIKWTQPVDYQLLERLIRYNLEDKADCTSFWRT